MITITDEEPLPLLLQTVFDYQKDTLEEALGTVAPDKLGLTLVHVLPNGVFLDTIASFVTSVPTAGKTAEQDAAMVDIATVATGPGEVRVFVGNGSTEARMVTVRV